MTSTTARADASRTGDHRTYWAVTSLFCLIFIFSGVWTLVDPQGARDTLERLGFPAYFAYPQAAAKLAGVAVILWGRWRTLSGLAFAGFFYDVVLALGAHVAEGDPDVALAAFAIVVIGAAYLVDRRRFGSATVR